LKASYSVIITSLEQRFVLLLKVLHLIMLKQNIFQPWAQINFTDKKLNVNWADLSSLACKIICAAASLQFFIAAERRYSMIF
jgi:hypothetical protein